MIIDIIASLFFRFYQDHSLQLFYGHYDQSTYLPSFCHQANVFNSKVSCNEQKKGFLKLGLSCSNDRMNYPMEETLSAVLDNLEWFVIYQLERIIQKYWT